MVIKNFLFHRVSDDTDRMWPPMKPSLFERIIKKITAEYNVIPLEPFLEDTGAFKAVKKLATVMFDDGYKDNIEVAAPILKKYTCPASFYVVSGCIDDDIPTWTYVIDNVLQATRVTKIELPFEFVPARFKLISLKAEDGKINEAKDLKPWLKTLPNAQRLLLIQALLEQCNDAPPPSGKMMNWDNIRELKSAGFIIGSHSHTHPMLASLADEKEIAEELTVSARRIKQETGTFPLTISYPIGSYDERVKRLSLETGYKFGLAVEQRFFHHGEDDLFEIPRVELYQEPWWKTNMRMSGWYARLKKLQP